MTNKKRRLNTNDLKQIRLLLFGKYGRGWFRVRSSPIDDGSEHGGDHTMDARLWNKNDPHGSPIHDDVDFPIWTNERVTNDPEWPIVEEGLEFDLYVHQPDNDPYERSLQTKDDWDFGNHSATYIDGEWVIDHIPNGPIKIMTRSY